MHHYSIILLILDTSALLTIHSRYLTGAWTIVVADSTLQGYPSRILDRSLLTSQHLNMTQGILRVVNDEALWIYMDPL